MEDSEIREQVWKYFELHTKQRMTLFNFFITISIAIVSGIGVFLNFEKKPELLIITLGVVLSILSALFCWLDLRTRSFIVRAENVLRLFEMDYPNDSFRVFPSEKKDIKKHVREQG